MQEEEREKREEREQREKRDYQKVVTDKTEDVDGFSFLLRFHPLLLILKYFVLRGERREVREKREGRRAKGEKRRTKFLLT